MRAHSVDARTPLFLLFILSYSHPSRALSLLASVSHAERNAARQAKLAAKLAAAAGETPPEGGTGERPWIKIDNVFLALARDGRGYHDGDGIFFVYIEVAELGEHFYPRGEVSIYVQGVTEIHSMPEAAPPSGTIKFQVDVSPMLGRAVFGRMSLAEIMVCPPMVV